MTAQPSIPSGVQPPLNIECRSSQNQVLLAAGLFLIGGPFYYLIKGRMTPLLWLLAVCAPFVVFKLIQFLFSNQALLRLNESGIIWHQWKCAPIRWLDVKRVYCQRAFNVEYVCLELFNEDIYKRQFSLARRAMPPVGVPFFSIPTALLDHSTEQVYRLIATEVQRRRNQQQSASFSSGM